MKKQFFKTLNLENYKFILFVFLICMVGCTKEITDIENNESIDDNPVSNQYENDNFIFTVSGFSDFQQNPTFQDLVSNFSLESSFMGNTIDMGRDNTSNLYGFIIDTTQIKQVSNDEYTSFTFKIILDESNIAFSENLVVENGINGTRAYKVSYIPDNQWLQDTSNGIITEFNGTARFEEIQTDNANRSNTANRSGCGSVYVWVDTKCSCLGHWPGEPCTCGQNGNTGTPANSVRYTFDYPCPDEGADYSEGPIGPRGGGGGAVGTPSPGDSGTSPIGITNIDNPCNPPVIGDINTDCHLDSYEFCILSGGTPFDCSFESWVNSLTEEEIAEYNWYEDQSQNETLANELMDCFLNIDTISPSATYSLTIYVEQPIPNSDAPNNGTDPGHTFISMSINDPLNSDNNITQTLGFYPQDSVNPVTGNNVVDGLFVDNSGHNYHVSATINLNNSSFYQIVNQIDTLGNSTPEYDLENYNCTDFGITIANAAGMNLPDTEGIWGIDIPVIGFKELGSGSNPGSLGQDIRNLSNPDVTVNTTSGSAGPIGNGPCN